MARYDTAIVLRQFFLSFFRKYRGGRDSARNMETFFFPLLVGLGSILPSRGREKGKPPRDEVTPGGEAGNKGRTNNGKG